MAYDEINLGALLTPYQAVTEPLYANAVINFLKAILLPPSWIKWVSGLQTSYASTKGGENGVHAGDVFEVYYIPEIEKKTATAVIVQNNYDMHVGNKIRSKR